MSRRQGRETEGDTDPRTDYDNRAGAHAGDRDEAREDAGVAEAHDRFGGINWGASFFGWLVAIALTVLLSSIIAAVATAIGTNENLTQNQAQRNAGAIGLAAAIALVVVLLIAYYAGGYVAGRMSRFDGGRQGVGVWVIGLLITLIAVAIGAIFGDQYNVMDRVNLPRLPVPTSDATIGGIITGLVVLFGTLLAAIAGGGVGRRYHSKVDRTVYP
jgi:amino acid transporter